MEEGAVCETEGCNNRKCERRDQPRGECRVEQRTRNKRRNRLSGLLSLLHGGMEESSVDLYSFGVLKQCFYNVQLNSYVGQM